MRIELSNVSKHFGPLSALRGVSLSIPSGSRVALIGPNGSGKSTLTRILMGILAAEGEVRLDGLEPGVDQVRLAQKLAYVPQIAPHFGASVDEVIRAIARVRHIDPVEIEALAGRLDLTLAPIRRQSFRNLSGGMKQKLLIALALASRASLLIMDEPTASLDAHARERFFELLSEQAGDATLLLCSHRWEELRHLVDHVVAMEDGQVVYEGAAESYLDGRVLSVIEVHVQSPDLLGPMGSRLQERLRERLMGWGFRTGREGWWARTVTHTEKLELAPQVAAELGSRLNNLLIRDLETIDLSRNLQEANDAIANS